MTCDQTVRFGVVGLGFMGRTHVASMARVDQAVLSAVVDRDVSRLGKSSSVEGNLDTGRDEFVFDSKQVGVFANVDSMLEKCDIDLALIATPTPTHIELASTLVSAGIHVMIEKPVSLDLAAMHRLEDLARDRGVIAMPAHCMRFWPAWNWMHQRIRELTYGPVVRASFVRTGAAPSWNPEFYRDPSKSGGAIVDLHIHDTDFVLHCFGMPDAVSSTGSRSHVRTEYHFEGGPVVEAVGGWLEDPKAPFTMNAEIEFQEATISFSLGRDPEIMVLRPGGIECGHPEASMGGTGYDVQAAALIDSIISESGVPPVSLGDAVRTGSVLELEIRSLQSAGEAMPIP